MKVIDKDVAISVNAANAIPVSMTTERIQITAPIQEIVAQAVRQFHGRNQW